MGREAVAPALEAPDPGSDMRAAGGGWPAYALRRGPEEECACPPLPAPSTIKGRHAPGEARRDRTAGSTAAGMGPGGWGRGSSSREPSSDWGQGVVSMDLVGGPPWAWDTAEEDEVWPVGCGGAPACWPLLLLPGRSCSGFSWRQKGLRLRESSATAWLAGAASATAWLDRGGPCGCAGSSVRCEGGRPLAPESVNVAVAGTVGVVILVPDPCRPSRLSSMVGGGAWACVPEARLDAADELSRGIMPWGASACAAAARWEVGWRAGGAWEGSVVPGVWRQAGWRGRV